MTYCFYIWYLDMKICLYKHELDVWADYREGRIGFSEFIRQAMAILRAKGVPRGRLYSVAMYILGLYEEKRYTVNLVVVEFDWTGRTEYCKRSGHHMVTECNVTGDFECVDSVFYEKEDEIRNRLAEALWDGYMEFLEEEYVRIRESSTSEGFSTFEVVRHMEREISYLSYNIRSARFYRANECGGELRHLEYYDDKLMSYIDDAVKLFKFWLEGECGIRE
jgi:hypothetical protein